MRELKDQLIKLKNEKPNKVWMLFDDFTSTLCFSICSPDQKERFSDILLVDSLYDNGHYNLILFKGVDSYGHQMVLFVCIS